MSEEKKYETTAQLFDKFVLDCKFFIALFGLFDWQIDYRHSEKKDHRAYIDFHWQGKMATIALCKNWESDEPNDFNIKRDAFHEVCELLLADSYIAACDIDLTPQLRREALERARHAVIRRMENCVLPLL